MDGGRGKDVLTGGTLGDIFAYSEFDLSSTALLADSIRDFSPTEDLISFNYAYSSLSPPPFTFGTQASLLVKSAAPVATLAGLHSSYTILPPGFWRSTLMAPLPAGSSSSPI